MGKQAAWRKLNTKRRVAMKVWVLVVVIWGSCIQKEMYYYFAEYILCMYKYGYVLVYLVGI